MARDVPSYIAAAPKAVQPRLRQIRAAIRAVAPQAEEKLSYGMPYYGLNGRLAYFAYAKNHIGLYIPPPIIHEHASLLMQYVTKKATVQFPHDKPLPVALIKRLVRARATYNLAK